MDEFWVIPVFSGEGHSFDGCQFIAGVVDGTVVLPQTEIQDKYYMICIAVSVNMPYFVTR
jgi:hypothetical protein